MDPNSTVKRNEHGQLLPGSKLALGRSKTIGEAQKIREMVEPKRTELIERLFALTKRDGAEGVKACEILLGYLAARPRPTAELVYVPGIAEGESLEAKCEAVLSAVADGEVTSTAALELLSVIHKISEIVHLPRLKAKLKSLEDGSDLA